MRKVKRVEVLSDDEGGNNLIIPGVINGREKLCEVDTGADICIIPARLAEGVAVTGKAQCYPLGSEFMADSSHGQSEGGLCRLSRHGGGDAGQRHLTSSPGKEPWT